MTINEKMNSIKKTARIAGVLTLLIAVFAPFSMLYVPSMLVVPGDAAATANHIIASEGLFRLGIASDSLVFMIEIVLTVLLYVLLKRVSKTLALVAAFARLAMTVIQGINVLNHVFVLLLLSGAGYLTAFAPEQLHALALLFLNAHKYGVSIWEIFFGLHLIVLGYLVYKSGYLPRILGVLLMLGAVGYLMESYSNFLFPNNQALSTIYSVLLGISALGELAFAFWLVLKGVNIEQWEKRGLESA